MMMMLMLVKYRSEDAKQTEDQRRRQRGPAAVSGVGLEVQLLTPKKTKHVTCQNFEHLQQICCLFIGIPVYCQTTGDNLIL